MHLYLVAAVMEIFGCGSPGQGQSALEGLVFGSVGFHSDLT